MRAEEIWLAIPGKVMDLLHRSEARGCRVIRSTAQTIPTAAFTMVEFDTEIADTDACWSSASPGLLYAQRQGYYLAGGCFGMNTGGTSAFRILARLSGVIGGAGVSLGQSGLVTGVNANLYVSVTSGMIYLDNGDLVRLYAYQDSGSDKHTLAATETDQLFCAAWLARVS